MYIYVWLVGAVKILEAFVLNDIALFVQLQTRCWTQNQREKKKKGNITNNLGRKFFWDMQGDTRIFFYLRTQAMFFLTFTFFNILRTEFEIHFRVNYGPDVTMTLRKETTSIIFY